MDTSPSRAATAPTDFPELQTFPTEHLQELLTSKEAFQKLVGSYVDKSQPVHVSCLGNSSRSSRDMPPSGVQELNVFILSSDFRSCSKACH